ncbi:site-specific integrase [Streptomyces lavendulae]|uniref:tyrosine-type recombinase/integrase n=1 Tax=Streptomyces lavendulae TaxID=1914 RepID=UPI0033C2AB2D
MATLKELSGWQRQHQLVEDALNDPRALALPNWETLQALAKALVARSHGEYQGWGDVVTFAASTSARIGEVSGVRVKDIDTDNWIWTLRRQTTPAPGGLVDKATKGKRARKVPLIEEVRPMVAQRLLAIGNDPDARIFFGPRGGRISTAVLRDATHWDDVVTELGFKHLRRHDLRHTGLTWFADVGVPLHVLRKIAGHGSLTTTQRYLHPDAGQITAAGAALFRAPHGAPCTSFAASHGRHRDLTRTDRPGPQLVPKNDQGAVLDCSKTAPDLRLFRVGTTGFEPATP